MTDREVVQKTIELFQDPDKWAQCGSAYDSEGRWIFPKDPDACRWCVSGAFEKFLGSWSDADHLIRRISSDLSCRHLVEINDFHGREAVLEKLEQYLEVSKND